MNHSICMVCGRAGAGLRPLPRPDETSPHRFTAAPVCESCVAPAVEVLRDVVRRAEVADTDEADDVDRMVHLIAFLGSHGLEIGEAGSGFDGQAAKRRALHAILDSLERQLICSQCWSRGPESRIHVIPYFNNTVGRYVTAFRCDGCIDGALAETIARVTEVDGPVEIDTLGDLFRSHGVFVREWMRGDPLDRLRPAMVNVLASLRGASVRLRLRLGTTAPVH